MSTFQFIVVPCLAIVAVWMVIRTIRREVPRGTGVVWAAVWTSAALLVAAPMATAVIARWLGIGRGADLVLYGATLAGLSIALYFYNRSRRLEEILTVLVRRESLRQARRGTSANSDRDGQHSTESTAQRTTRVAYD